LRGRIDACGEFKFKSQHFSIRSRPRLRADACGILNFEPLTLNFFVLSSSYFRKAWHFSLDPYATSYPFFVPVMSKTARTYTVKQLSGLSGVSVRTLHHYDEIGLLKPGARSEAGYRFYGREELLRLQQILFYRELEFPLRKIRELLDDPGFELLSSLEFHRGELRKRSKQLKRLLATIDKTIDELKNKTAMLTDKELYEGFPPGKGEEYREEAASRWGEDTIRDSEERLKKLGKEGFEKLKQEGDAITRRLAALMERDPADAEVQETIALHFRYTGNFFEVTPEAYRGLGKMYVEDERFKAFYEKYAAGLAEFICAGIEIFCDGREGK